MATYNLTVIILPTPVVQPPQVDHTITAQQKLPPTTGALNPVFQRGNNS